MIDFQETVWPRELLRDLFELDTTACVPSNAPRDRFLHYSIPAWDETGGPIVQLGSEIESNKFALTRPCVIVSKLNPRISRVCVFRPETGQPSACASTELMAYVPKSDRVVMEFFAHYMRSELFRHRLERAATGTTNSHVRARPTETLTWKVPYPSPEEQRAIARVLDAADAAIERTRAAVEAARRVKRGLVQALLTRGIGHTAFKSSDVGSIPESWSVVTVADLITEAQYGLSMPMEAKGQYPILRMAAIQDGDVLLGDLKYVALPDELAAQYLLHRGDILFNRTNSLDLVGKVGVFRSDLPAVFASYLIRLKVRPELANNYYLGQLLASHAVQCRIRRYATPGVQQVNINATNLKRVQVALPLGPSGLAEQERIAELLERQDASVRQLQGRITLLERLKRGLMQVLLTGKVRVPAAE